MSLLIYVLLPHKPVGAFDDACEWRGKVPFCDPSACADGQWRAGQSSSADWGDFGSSCTFGEKKYCCKLEGDAYFGGAAPFCSPSSCRPDYEQVGTHWGGDGHYCETGTKKFCISKKELGFKPLRVSMYEHGWFGGWREEHDEQLANCINVNHPYAISSLDTHNTCVRVYTEPHCDGTSYLVLPGKHSLIDGHMNDKIASLSPCFESDETQLETTGLFRRDPQRKYNWEPRRRGPYANVLIFLMELARRGTREQPAPAREGAPQPVYYIGHGGRTESMQVVLTRENLARASGSGVSDTNRRWVQSFGLGYHAGHILARASGGSGTDSRNIFPQNPSMNRSGFSSFEAHARNMARNGHTVTYSVYLQYATDTNMIPFAYVGRIQLVADGRVRVYQHTFHNELPGGGVLEQG